MKKIGSRILNLSYSIIIGLVVNYIVYAFQHAIVLSILPMLLAIFLFVCYLRKTDERLWQYLCIFFIVIISYMFYSDMYIRGKKLCVVAAVLAFILAVWAILCIKNKIAFRKEAIFYVAAFILIYAAGCSLIWFYYNNMAAATIDFLIKNENISLLEDYEAVIMNAASNTDGLCQEIDTVFYASDKIYCLSDLAYGYCYYGETYWDEYHELLEKLDFNKIRLLLDNVPLLNQKFN